MNNAKSNKPSKKVVNAITPVAPVAPVANSDKTNVILSLVETHQLLQTMVTGTKCKVFTDSKFYTGFGVKCNGFSVNTKKTKYNIYCNDNALTVVKSISGLSSVTIIENGNKTDKTRPHYIECKSTTDLKTMIDTIINQLYKVATDNN